MKTNRYVLPGDVNGYSRMTFPQIHLYTVKSFCNLNLANHYTKAKVIIYHCKIKNFFTP